MLSFSLDRDGGGAAAAAAAATSLHCLRKCHRWLLLILCGKAPPP